MRLFLVRHGETEWSLAGKHTGRQDIPLLAAGEEAAKKLGRRLAGRAFSKVFMSPLQRARRTCELCGYGGGATPVPDLMEWDYGQYEGLKGSEIRAQRAGWRIFRDGCPGGEQPADVIARVDRVLPTLRAPGGDVLVFAHGHLLRVLMARWSGLPLENAAHFGLDPASLSILSRDAQTGDGVVERWNDVAHLEP
jgi:probable phosphoglycerate mutase